ncbi:MAG: PfkB family carbohydrate kinase [Halieaceae bacterium]|nr:PfkB family carbohydrate kinase [Halieaceae bacterium]
MIGDAAIDRVEANGRCLELPGGTGANISVALSRLGVRSGLITKLGTDRFADALIEKLKREAVDTQYVSFSEVYATASVTVAVDELGERVFSYPDEPGADSQLQCSDIPHFEAGDWLCVSSFALSQRRSREATFFAIARARNTGCIVIVDANMRADRWDDRALLVPATSEALGMADIAKVSEDELLLLTGAGSLETAIRELRQWPAKIKIITRAERGAILLTAGAEFHCQGYAVPAIDMTGAGDAFTAAFISRLLSSENWSDVALVDAVEFSNACGALVVGKVGAMSGLPDSKTVNTFMAERGRYVGAGE